jgi:hypothetical protein
MWPGVSHNKVQEPILQPELPDQGEELQVPGAGRTYGKRRTVPCHTYLQEDLPGVWNAIYRKKKQSEVLFTEMLEA